MFHIFSEQYLAFYLPLMFIGVLILGNTGKVITQAHENSGVATVASLALAKLLVPLKQLKIEETEYVLLKEIVLFNPGKKLCCDYRIYLVKRCGYY